MTRKDRRSSVQTKRKKKVKEDPTPFMTYVKSGSVKGKHIEKKEENLEENVKNKQNPHKKQPSETVIKESGVYTRTYYRKGKKRQIHTEKVKKNPKKVLLERFGDLDVYVYPYDYPDKAHFGKYSSKFSMTISKHDLPILLRIYQILRWYFSGYWQIKSNRTKQAKRRACAIQKAYNYALNEQRRKD